ncbi:MAG TPA: cysteine peptidase family C39 domain-containing protein [Candidatus Hydrogenedentes bacterium]|nr:cysteine peptidase family C39 domain-containing protein [Candidatus Hydrogenedentota bacterium]HOH29966.1 cysteine peptidase family C39 domain-containing protein [Candidatus Hydrogenedentota bacterium]
MGDLYLWNAWLLLCWIVWGGCLAAGAEPDQLIGQSCAVRCAGYLEQRLLNRSPALGKLRAALGTEQEAASLEQLRTYLEEAGLHTLPCEWTGKAVARWKGDLYLLIHSFSGAKKQGHFMVVEKNDAGITVVDWPRKQFFSNSYGGIRRWRAYAANGTMTPIGLLVDTHPITLPDENTTPPLFYLYLSGGVMAVLLFSLLLVIGRSRYGRGRSGGNRHSGTARGCP